ncbi:MAG: hypothetical protein LBT47_06240 [Deltaproteobacteria bacterium]|jgi:exopolyphosphatase/guanosine-5'-triphosphate,3'-diphosphate pyrophosphatase|nr:hypothetical protein [Deltaproteobacteria bacterium]
MTTGTKLAALDLGSNTFRLIVADFKDGSPAWETKKVWQSIPRISEGLIPNGRFAQAPRHRALQALEEFADIIAALGPSRVLAGGTMAFRQAADGAEFLTEASNRYGWEAFVLSGSQEARLSALGVMTALAPLPDEGLIFDIGGRSTEFINTSRRELLQTQSLAMGVVGLTETHVRSDPPAPSELAAMTSQVHSILQNADWSAVGRPTLVGTAGTVTTVAAMLMKLVDYDAAAVNNQTFGRHQIGRLLDLLAGQKINQRLSHPGLHPRRADVIVAGLVEVTGIMDFFGQDLLTVSDNSLLEGLWLACADLVPLGQTTHEVIP